jgi:hypothetical protein
VKEYAPFASVVAVPELVPERETVTPKMPASPASKAPFPLTSL